MSGFQDNATFASAPPPASSKWKWIVLICLLPVGGLLCCCGSGVTLFMAGMSQVKSSETYTEAMRRAQAEPRVQQLLGEPITDGWSVQSNYRTTNGVGEMNIEIPLSGPKGSAKLMVQADNETGEWKYARLEVRSPGGEVIDLRTDEDEKN